MTHEPPYQDHPILPGRGGLDTETDAALIDATRSPDLENIHFSKQAIEGAFGSRKLHRYLPRLAGVRSLPRPIVRVAAQARIDQVPHSVIPYVAEQQLAATDDMQIDVSFRLNGSYPYTLTGRDQTEDSVSTPPKSGKINAPAGGEFQFQPLAQRGGTDIEELIWVLGLAIIRPEGYKTASGTPDTAVDASQKDVIFPVFYWWSEADRRMKFAAANTYLVPGFDYHLSLQIGKQTTGTSAWYLTGPGGETVALGEVPVGDGATLLPLMDDISRDRKNAIYLCRPMMRDTGVWPDAPLFRGHYGVTAQAYTSNALAEDDVQINDLALPGVGANSYVHYYLRVNDPGNANDGEIRRITTYNGSNSVKIGADMPNPAAMVGATVDVIPPMECCPQDVVLSELRLWNTHLTQAQIQSLAGWRFGTDLTSAEPFKNLGGSVLGDDAKYLIGYWPLSEDGGTLLEDLGPRKNNGWMSGSVKHRSARDGTVSLDGDRVSIQMDLGEDIERHPALSFNLGEDGYRLHYRLTYQLCRDIVNRAVWAIQVLNAGTDTDTVTVQDGAGGSETFEIDDTGAVTPGNVAVDILGPPASLNAEETASRLKTAIDSAIGGTLGSHLSTEVSGSVVYVYSNDVDFPFPAIAFSETGSTFSVREAPERGYYETIHDFDNPKGTTPEPILSLRWTKVNGNRWLYFLWHNGVATYIVPVDRTFAFPVIGQRVNALFGIHKGTGSANDHRFYYFVSNGADAVQGWSETVNLATDVLPGTFAVPDSDKSRLSIGASIVGEPTMGSGQKNACLMRVWEFWVGFRPFMNLVGSPTLIRFPAIDPWTTLDRVLAPADVMPVIAADASTVALEQGSTVFSPTSGQNFSTRLDSYPTKYLLLFPGVPTLHLEEDRSQRTEVRLAAVDAMTLAVGTFASPWDRGTLASAEARVAAYLWGTDFEAATPFFRIQTALGQDVIDPETPEPGYGYEPEEINLSSIPPDGEDWALTELYQDKGALAYTSSEPGRWMVAIVPSSVGVPQELFQPAWADGLVVGVERVRGLGQLELPSGQRDIVAGVGGGLYLIDDRWVRDHPVPSATDRYSVRLRNRSPHEAELLEELLEERLRESWRNRPHYGEGIQLPDSGSIRVALPRTGAGTEFYLFKIRVKLNDVAGKRTLGSRVGMKLRTPGRDLVELQNWWWYLEDGCPVFRIDNFDDFYQVKLGSSELDLVRDNLVLGKWVEIWCEIEIDWGAVAFGTPAFYFEGRRFENTLITGTLTPDEIPTHDQPTGDWLLRSSSSWLGVYGNDDPYVTGSWANPNMVSFRYGIGGQLSKFRMESNTNSEPPVPPHI